MREIKFRAWSAIDKVMWTHEEICYDGVSYKEVTTNLEGLHLMQFTGLLDKQGVEIYDGDILSRSFMDDYPNQKSYVCFEDCGYKLKVKNGGNRPMSDRAGWCELRRYGEIEVIGNIYENSNLLGEK